MQNLAKNGNKTGDNAIINHCHYTIITLDHNMTSQLPQSLPDAASRLWATGMLLTRSNDSCCERCMSDPSRGRLIDDEDDDGDDDESSSRLCR